MWKKCTTDNCGPKKKSHVIVLWRKIILGGVLAREHRTPCIFIFPNVQGLPTHSLIKQVTTPRTSVGLGNWQWIGLRFADKDLIGVESVSHKKHCRGTPKAKTLVYFHPEFWLEEWSQAPKTFKSHVPCIDTHTVLCWLLPTLSEDQRNWQKATTAWEFPMSKPHRQSASGVKFSNKEDPLSHFGEGRSCKFRVAPT
jgi:hypothetical protein